MLGAEGDSEGPTNGDADDGVERIVREAHEAVEIQPHDGQEDRPPMTSGPADSAQCRPTVAAGWRDLLVRGALQEVLKPANVEQHVIDVMAQK
jgi:hypothetical protein